MGGEVRVSLPFLYTIGSVKGPDLFDMCKGKPWTLVDTAAG